MREIVFMQIGHCGNKVGQKFWELVSNEHCLDSEGHYIGSTTVPRQRIDVYYDLGAHETYIPRSIFIDLEPGTLRSLQKSTYGNYKTITYNQILSLVISYRKTILPKQLHLWQKWGRE